MNLHEQLDQLIAAQNKTNELLAQIAGGSVKSADAPSTTTTGKGKTSAAKGKSAPADDKPSITVEQAHDAAMELKDKHGVAVVKAILQKNKVAKLAEMTEAQAPGVYNDCLAKMKELDDAAADDEDDGI